MHGLYLEWIYQHWKRNVSPCGLYLECIKKCIDYICNEYIFIEQKNIVFLQTDQRAIHLLFRIWTPSFWSTLDSFGAGGLHCGSEERKEPTSISAQSFYQTEGGGKLSVPVLLQQIRTDFFARTTNDKSWLILENLEILERDVIWLKTAGFRLEAQNNCWNFLFAWRKQTTFSLLTQEVFVKNEKEAEIVFLKDFLIMPPLSFGFWRVLAAIFRSSWEKFGCDYAS